MIRIIGNLVLATIIIVASTLSTAHPVRAQDNVTTTIYLPVIHMFIGRINNPIAVPAGSIMRADEPPTVVECVSHPDHHARIWVEKANSFVPRTGDVFNLRFKFFDGLNPDFTYLPNSEIGDTVSAANWEWVVRDNNGVDLDALISYLREFGPPGMADKVVALRSREATVQVFQVNQRWFWKWIVPTQCGHVMHQNDIYARWSQFSAEIWGPDSTQQQ